MEAAGHKIPGMAHRRGFTLIEIIAVLALIGLIATVLINGSAAMLNNTEDRDPESVLLGILQKVRGEAVESGQIIELVQLPEDKGFLWGTEGVAELPLVKGGAVGRASLIGGQMQEELLQRMRFYPDGSCDPARLEVRRGDARRVFAIDPWTSAPLPGGGPAS